MPLDGERGFAELRQPSLRQPLYPEYDSDGTDRLAAKAPGPAIFVLRLKHHGVSRNCWTGHSSSWPPSVIPTSSYVRVVHSQVGKGNFRCALLSCRSRCRNFDFRVWTVNIELREAVRSLVQAPLMPISL